MANYDFHQMYGVIFVNFVRIR